MKKTPKTTTSEAAETPAAIAEAIFTAALRAIRDEIELIQAGKARKSKFGKPERIAYLAKQASAFVAEQRKVAAMDQKRIDQLTPAMVLAWLRQIGPDQRARVLREAQVLEERRSGLA